MAGTWANEVRTRDPPEPHISGGRGRCREARGAVLIVGVDENGLGPLLGPLVTTCVGLSAARYRREHHLRLGRELGIDDSKVTSGFGSMAAAEGLCLALVEALHGSLPGDADALFQALFLHAPAELKRPCPTHSAPQCWREAIALPCFGGEPDRGREILRQLGRRGVRPRYARSAVACTGELNRRLAAGQSRVEVDLELMELLVLDAHRTSAAPLHAICGMVGGIRRYADKLRHFPMQDARVRRGAGGAFIHDLEGVGQVRFEIDADSRHLPVALASMVGKYVRELWMERQNRFYQAHRPALEAVSGYHDPVTRRFIAASLGLRRELGIADACFVRDSAKSQKERRQLALFS